MGLFQRLLKKQEVHTPRELKSARQFKTKALSGTAKAVPFQNIVQSGFFRSL